MTVGYHVAGVVNLVFYAIALAGTAHQLAVLRGARAAGDARAIAVVSLNQLAVSFLAYYAFFVYGYCVRPFNHYLVWPRLVGVLLVLAILVELARARPDRRARLAATLAAWLLLPALGLLVFAPELAPEAKLLPQVLSVVAAVLVVQGYLHQIALVRRAGEGGAVSFWMHLGTFIKDFSLAGLGLAMGLAAGWPLVLMGGASVAVKAVLIAELLRRRRGAG